MKSRLYFSSFFNTDDSFKNLEEHQSNFIEIREDTDVVISSSTLVMEDENISVVNPLKETSDDEQELPPSAMTMLAVPFIYLKNRIIDYFENDPVLASRSKTITFSEWREVAKNNYDGESLDIQIKMAEIRSGYWNQFTQELSRKEKLKFCIFSLPVSWGTKIGPGIAVYKLLPATMCAFGKFAVIASVSAAGVGTYFCCLFAARKGCTYVAKKEEAELKTLKALKATEEAFTVAPEQEDETEEHEAQMAMNLSY